MARFTSRCVLIVSSFATLGLASCESARFDQAELDYYTYTHSAASEGSASGTAQTPYGPLGPRRERSPFLDPLPTEPGPASPIAEPIAEPVVEARVVVMQRGDSLYSLSARHLGSGRRWREIAALNSLSDADVRRISVGRKIKLPAR